MAKRSYRMVVAVERVTMSGLPPHDEMNLQQCIQTRYDEGWTYRGLAGVDGQYMYLSFVRKEAQSR